MCSTSVDFEASGPVERDALVYGFSMILQDVADQKEAFDHEAQRISDGDIII